MKKLFLAIFIVTLLLIPQGFCAANEIPQPSAGTDAPILTDNRSRQNYTRWSAKVHSYLADNGDGTVTRVAYGSDGITAEKYNSLLRFVSGTRIPMELPVFGGFYAGSDFYFIVFGQNN